MRFDVTRGYLHMKQVKLQNFQKELCEFKLASELYNTTTNIQKKVLRRRPSKCAIAAICRVPLLNISNAI